ncbi:MAG: glucosylceramidase [Candidatus Binatota bacterium]|nr:glucosylceramidase [Candidatus Binatota bacterium]
MTRLAVLGGLALSLLLAIAVTAVGTHVVERDSARATHVSGGGSGSFLLAHDDTGTLGRERFDPLLRAPAAVISDRATSFLVEHALGLMVVFFSYFAAIAWSGAPAGWSGAGAAAFAIALSPLERLGHPLWTPSPWLVLFGWGLVALARSPTAPIAAGTLLALVLLRLGSELYFRAALPLVAVFTLLAGPRSREHGAAAVLLLATVILSFAWPTATPPPAWATLGEAARTATASEWLAQARFVELACLAAFALAAITAAARERSARGAAFAALVLVWASLDGAILAGWRIPPLRPFRWVPDGGEHMVPIVFVVGAAAVLIASGARALSQLAPPRTGVIAAVILAAVAVSAGLASAPPAGAFASGSAASAAPPGAGELRVLAWPLAFAPLAMRLEEHPSARFANLEPRALVAFVRFLPVRPNTFWTEAFWQEARKLDLDAVEFLERPPTEEIPWAWLAPLAPPASWRLSVPRALADFAGLERVPSDGWLARSNGANPAVLPESAALDDRADTRWGSGGPQHPGLEYEIDLGREVEGLRRAVLDGGTWRTDYPRAVAVEVATGGGEWVRVASDPRPEVQGRYVVLDFAPRRARRIRFVELDGDPVFDWSIAEVSLWRGSGVSPAAASDTGADRAR